LEGTIIKTTLSDLGEDRERSAVDEPDQVGKDGERGGGGNSLGDQVGGKSSAYAPSEFTINGEGRGIGWGGTQLRIE